MASLYDTNAYKRGGGRGADYVRNRATAILSLPIDERLKQIRQLDLELIAMGINCGGCADTLAAAIFLDKFNSIAKRLT